MEVENKLEDEVSNLPYQNAVDAIEFSSPSIMTNETLPLYILAFPKVEEKPYRLTQLHPTIHEEKQVMLQHPTSNAASAPDTGQRLCSAAAYR